MSDSENRELRLTLRTLLAWLDDLLSPADVRQIGQKVSESSVAQGLITKIRKVTRRRRLTVPSASGADGTDPNLVASYLDNELSAEKVAEYEEKCLRSDVDLAEVASCHQILSMISQRAKVPPAAKFRMYRLIKGREAISRDTGRRYGPAPEEPAAKPIPVWEPSGGVRRRSTLERYGPLAAAVLLMALMSVSAWIMIPDSTELAFQEPQRPGSESILNGGLASADVRRPGPGLNGQDLGAMLGQPAEETPAGEPGDAEGSEVGEGAVDAARPGDAALPATGDLGTVDNVADMLLLRWDASQRLWTRLAGGEKINPQDQLVSPAPFEPRLKLGSLDVRLQAPTSIQVLEPADDGSNRIVLAEGRLVLVHPAGGSSIIAVDSQECRLDLPPGIPVGLERVQNWPVGADLPSAPSLVISTTEGRVGLSSGAQTHSLTGPGLVVLRAPARFTDASSGPVPKWLTDASPADADLVAGQEFLEYFGLNVSTKRALLEAIEDESPAVRRLAIETLSLLGAVDLVAAAMAQSGDVLTRLAASRALRGFGARSPVSTQQLREQLASFNGPVWADLVFALLSGYTEEEERQKQTYTELVALLEHNDVTVRTLALDQLMRLTGRDTLQYDPNKPTGPGLEAWKGLLRTGNIHPSRELDSAPKVLEIEGRPDDGS